jgi:hypothetical protein
MSRLKISEYLPGVMSVGYVLVRPCNHKFYSTSIFFLILKPILDPADLPKYSATLGSPTTGFAG